MVSKLRQTIGVTLMEMVIVSGILGTVVLVASPMMLKSIQFFILQRTKLELQREARDAMNLMTRQLRQAQSNTIRIDQVSGQPYYSRIRFTKQQGSTVSYYQNGTRLIQTTNNTTTTLSKNLQYMAFSFPRSDDLGIVSVAITLQQAIYEGRTKALHMASEKVEVMN